MKEWVAHICDDVKYLINYGHKVLRIETDEKCRENTFNEYSQAIAEILIIKPLEYTKERADNFRKEMTAYVNNQQRELTPYILLCNEIRRETDEDRRKALFDWLSTTITRPVQIDPLKYTKERADHFNKEMNAYLVKILGRRQRKRGNKNENKL